MRRSTPWDQTSSSSGRCCCSRCTRRPSSRSCRTGPLGCGGGLDGGAMAAHQRPTPCPLGHEKSAGILYEAYILSIFFSYSRGAHAKAPGELGMKWASRSLSLRSRIVQFPPEVGDTHIHPNSPEHSSSQSQIVRMYPRPNPHFSQSPIPPTLHPNLNPKRHGRLPTFLDAVSTAQHEPRLSTVVDRQGHIHRQVLARLDAGHIHPCGKLWVSDRD